MHYLALDKMTHSRTLWLIKHAISWELDILSHASVSRKEAEDYYSHLTDGKLKPKASYFFILENEENLHCMLRARWKKWGEGFGWSRKIPWKRSMVEFGLEGQRDLRLVNRSKENFLGEEYTRVLGEELLGKAQWWVWDSDKDGS